MTRSKLVYIQNNGSEIRPDSNLESRIHYAKMVVNLWSYSALSDGYRATIEKEWILKLILSLFLEDSVFPPSKYSKNDQENIIREISSSNFDMIPLEDIAKYASTNHTLACSFFYDACLIIALDKRVLTGESIFLKSFARMTDIADSEIINIIKDVPKK